MTPVRSVPVSLCLVGALLFQTACGASQVTETLSLVVAAASAVIDVTNPALAPVIAPYLTDVTNAVDFATTELASADSGALKTDKIAAKFAMIVQPSLPSGTASTVVLAIEAVTHAVSNFLTTIQATKAEFQSTPAGASAFFASGAKSLKVDQKKLDKIKKKNEDARKRLRELRK